MQLAGHLNPAGVGEIDIQYRHIGTVGEGEVQHLAAHAGVRDNLQVPLGSEQFDERPPDEMLVVGQQHTYHRSPPVL